MRTLYECRRAPVDEEVLQARQVDIAVKTVEIMTGIPRSDMRTKKRDRGIVTARKILAYVLARRTNLELRRIGKVVRNKEEHTTIIHYLKDVRAFARTNEVFRNLLDQTLKAYDERITNV